MSLALMVSASARADYKSIVLGDNPLAFYALNPGSDPSGTSPDLTGNGNDGVANSISPAIGPSSYITNAADFDGSSSFVDLSEGGNPGLLNFSGPITLEAWVQPASSSEFADIVAKGYDASSYAEITLRVNGPYGADYSGGSETTGGAEAVYVSGGEQTTNWAYAVVSFDGTNCSLYVNGGLVAQQADTNGSFVFSDDWVIGDGSSAGNGRLFNGNISEVAIYNYGLTAAQVLTHYYWGELNAAPATSPPIITTQPQSQATYVGGSVTLSVSVASAFPTTNQWLKNEVPMAGQIRSTLTLTNVQLGDAASYSVIVGNGEGTTNSLEAVISVFTPSDLDWSATNNSGIWDTSTSANWINLSNSQQTVFNPGDRVLFDDTPGVPITVTVNGTVVPSLITVDASTNNFSINGTGEIGGSGSLIKEGTSTLTILCSGNFTGTATISGGAVYAGNNCFDSISAMTITNASTLDLAGGTLSGNKPITVSGTGLNGEGAIYNSDADYPQETVNITLAGDTMFGGSARWDLASGSEINGAGNLTVDWSAGAGYGQWNTVSIGADISEVLVTNASTLGFSYMDTSCQNPGTMFTIGPSCQLTFYSGGFNGSFSAATGATITDYNGGVAFNGSIIHLFSGSTFYLYGAGIGVNGSNLIFENDALLASYYTSGSNIIGNAVTLNGVAHFVIGDHNMIYTGVVSGPGGFVEDYYNSEVVFSESNTYTGPTIIGSGGNSPEVALTGDGSISQSSLIFFGGTNASLDHLDVTGRSDQTLTLASGQTLAGIGAVNGNLVVSPGATISPAGSNTTIGITTGANSTGAIGVADSITLNGTTVIKLNGSGVNDSIQSAGGGLTYGGTLDLVNISGSPLAAGNSFQIFSATSYDGSFANITPATPGTGLLWDTSQLNTGLLNVVAVPPQQPAINSVAVSAGNLIFSGTNGTASGTFYVLTATNLTIPLANWATLSTNSFGADGSFSVTNAINLSTPQQFYIIASP